MESSGYHLPTLRRFRILIVSILFAWLPLCSTPILPMVQAATLTVTTCADTGVAGDGSLRGEIASALTGNIVAFGVDCPVTNPLRLTLGTLVVGADLTITASNPPHDIVVDGGHTTGTTGVRAFQVDTGVTARLDGLTIQHGNSTVTDCNGWLCGGGIYSLGTLTVANCTLSANAAQLGGAIYSKGGMLTVINSTLTGNYAATEGGGIMIGQGSLAVTNSTFLYNSSMFGGGIHMSVPVRVSGSLFSGNHSSWSGGGIENLSGSLTVTDTTFFGNSTMLGGGGIDGAGPTNITNSSFIGNTASGGGAINLQGVAVTNSTFTGNRAGSAGAISNSSGVMTLTNVTIARNVSDFGGSVRSDTAVIATNALVASNSVTTAGDPDVQGVFSSVSRSNLIGIGDGSSGIANGESGNKIGTRANPINPLLGSLGLFGGATQTIPLLASSPAIDAGDDATCAVAPVNARDQRGIKRPQGSHCDIGASEYNPVLESPPPRGGITPAPTAPSGPPPTRPPGGPAIASPNPLPTGR